MIITLSLPGVCHFKLSASHSREGDACHAPRTLTIHSGPGVGGRLPRRRRLARHDGGPSTLLADRRRQSERPCGRSTRTSRSITAYRRAPRRRPRTRGPTPSPCWARAVSCSGPSSIRSRPRCACHRGAPTPSRSSSRRRGSPGSRIAVVFRFSCGAYLRGGKDSGTTQGRNPS